MTLGRWTAALLGLVALTDLFAVVTDHGMYDTVRERAAAGAAVIDVYTTHAENQLMVVAAVAQAVAFSACGVVFLVWFHRVRVNAEVFRPDGHEMKRGWAIGGWFVPVANLWFPRRIAGDIWRASARAGEPRSEALLNLWWTLWLGSWALGRIASRAYDSAFQGDAAPVDAAGDGLLWMMASDGFDAVTAVVAAVFVLRLSAAQHEKAVALAAAVAAETAPAAGVPAPPATPVPPHGA
ncbi:DUF4328 domain-containing protein [Streptomyces fragilis]|uniref:DUF4328 domain-containing protein n=1 Tax=Streptomyces fragilis TaxID=67301 RepID=A0ABV2YIK2_9ACTN|nr:DUF4328 domain-containing protein [Streptomyces fragilis]